MAEYSSNGFTFRISNLCMNFLRTDLISFINKYKFFKTASKTKVICSV